MGIRLHKFMGYGLTDISCDSDGRIDDERINPQSILLGGGAGNDSEEAWTEAARESYRSWLQEQRTALEHKRKQGETVEHPAVLDRWYLNDQERVQRDRRYLRDCIAYQPEYGLANVLALQPLACADWKRYDDPIDYMTETFIAEPAGENGINHVEVFAHGIHPFNASYMDARTGLLIKDLQPIEVGWVLRDDERYEPMTADVISRLGFSDRAEFLQNVVPKVPQEIRDIAEFTGLFTHDHVWRQLRPLLYTYWA